MVWLVYGVRARGYGGERERVCGSLEMAKRRCQASQGVPKGVPKECQDAKQAVIEKKGNIF